MLYGSPYTLETSVVETNLLQPAIDGGVRHDRSTFVSGYGRKQEVYSARPSNQRDELGRGEVYQV